MCWPAAVPRAASACRLRACPAKVRSGLATRTCSKLLTWRDSFSARRFRLAGKRAEGRIPDQMERLKRRQDFVAAAKASYAAMPGFVVQARDRKDDAAPRVGFTATKKLGNAVVRNRVKRRLREIARLKLSAQARPGFDYVMIGRSAAMARSFAELEGDLNSALKRLHRKPHLGAEKAGADKETP